MRISRTRPADTADHTALTRRALMLAAASCALVSPLGSQAASPLSVVATTGMIADAARNVGGEHIDIRALMGPGVDPHAYRQTRSDIAAVAWADLVLYHGHYLEAQLVDLLADFAARKPVVAVGEGVPADRLIAHEDYANRRDPHVWMDPKLWRVVVYVVRDTLVDLLPDVAATLAGNAAAYADQLDALALYSEDVLQSVPRERRVLITAHDAFNYFGRAYGFEVIGIQGISTESEAGLNRIATLVDTLVDREVPAVFVETSVSDRNVRALIEGAAARGHEVALGGELYSDAMGEDGTYEGTYLGMIDHNVTTIARALGGVAPPRGRLGQLAAAS